MESSRFAEHSAPLYLTSIFFFEDAEELREVFAGEMERNTYSRFSNPDINQLVDKICTFKVTDDGLIRLSIGLENIEDIKQDIDQAPEKV